MWKVFTEGNKLALICKWKTIWYSCALKVKISYHYYFLNSIIPHEKSDGLPSQ